MIPIIRNSSRFLDVVPGFDGSSTVHTQNCTALASAVASNGDARLEKTDTLTELYTEDAE